MSKQKDYLDVDTPIPGQGYCCLSFVSPEKVIKTKERFFMTKFLQHLDSYTGDKIPDHENAFDMYVSANELQLEEDFHKKHNYQTTIRGLKIRGVYSTYEEAQDRAKMLQQKDRAFHVYVGQVGYWLPWEPNADNVQNQEYLESELNELMKNYRKNQVERDVYYAKQVDALKTADSKNGTEENDEKLLDNNPSSILKELEKSVY